MSMARGLDRWNAKRGMRLSMVFFLSTRGDTSFLWGGVWRSYYLPTPELSIHSTLCSWVTVDWYCFCWFEVLLLKNVPYEPKRRTLIGSRTLVEIACMHCWCLPQQIESARAQAGILRHASLIGRLNGREILKLFGYLFIDEESNMKQESCDRNFLDLLFRRRHALFTLGRI